MEVTPEPEPISFVVAVNDQRELELNLLASPVARSNRHQWILVDNGKNHRYTSISKLYTDAARDARHDLLFFMHQDEYLPDDWEGCLFKALAELDGLDPQWGVLGAVGPIPMATQKARGSKEMRGHWRDPHGYQRLGPLPAEVESLDEQWIGVRASRGLSFDDKLPGFHCYGIDLSLSARDRGMKSYAVDAFVWHKYRDSEGRAIERTEDSPKIAARKTAEFRAQFKASADYVRKKWQKYIPFQSTSYRWI